MIDRMAGGQPRQRNGCTSFLDSARSEPPADGVGESDRSQTLPTALRPSSVIDPAALSVASG